MTYADCYLLDVGQGTANVILLERNRAIVIDGGPSARVPLSLLKQYHVEHIERLIVSHNDTDHSNGVPAILTAHEQSTGKIVWLRDRPYADIGWIEKLRSTRTEEAMERLVAKFVRLETPGKSRRIWRDQDIVLDLLHPTFADNIKAEEAGSANATSGVLLLTVGPGVVLFPGDAPVNIWKAIHKRRGRVACDVLASPHHGGKISTAADPTADLDWLFQNGIDCRQAAVVSVGTKNTHGHPREDYVAALKKAGVQVMCTEITSACCGVKNMPSPGIIPAIDYRDPVSRCGVIAHANVASAVGCAGSVRVRMDATGAVVDRSAEHSKAVTRLKRRRTGKPMCLAAPK